MSGLKHANASLWQREEHDGSYFAEVAGWRLLVKWTPEKEPGAPHGFSWSAKRAAEGDAEEQALGSDELHEEINSAMVKAEEAALAAGDAAADAEAAH